MQFTTAFVLALAGFASARGIDSKACSGKAACVSNSACYHKFTTKESVQETAFNCGSSNITVQEQAQIKLAFRGGLAQWTEVPKAEFPTCDLGQPGPNSVLLKQVKGDIIAYNFIDYYCAGSVPTDRSCWLGTNGQNTGSTAHCKIYRNNEVCVSVSNEVLGSCPTY